MTIEVNTRQILVDKLQHAMDYVDDVAYALSKNKEYDKEVTQLLTAMDRIRDVTMSLEATK